MTPKTIPAGEWKPAPHLCVREAFSNGERGDCRVYCGLHPDAKLVYAETPDDPFYLGALHCPSCDAGETPRRRSTD